MSEVVNIYEAKTNLSRLVDRALAGDDIFIARAGKPLVRLTPLDEAMPRQPGLLKDLSIPDELFDSLTDDELKLWE